MFEKRVIVDGRGHLLGRLASIVAKEILAGQEVVVVRCEELNISGSLIRNKLKFHDFLRKHVNTNRARGPFHHRSPHRMLWRAIRGMIPHKTPRGALAMARLKVFEGIPAPYDKLRRVVVPQALKALRLAPGRKFCRIGDLAAEVGWRYAEQTKLVEERRKAKMSVYYERKKALLALRKQAYGSDAPAPVKNTSKRALATRTKTQKIRAQKKAQK
eukprot:TRINITY_DN453_c1_g1_i1.p1 TRINITY_DN453_c1_g1~~TRINITY_DN453_c1_g1_i1.p1  ORF type:complete len:215 (+),score=68.01 TRINITY_DN453_c1_g1_i1:201-845(+)